MSAKMAEADGVTIKEQLLAYIQKHGSVSFAELERHLGEATKGDCGLWLDEERNLLLWGGASEEFADAVLCLLKEGKLVMKLASVLVYLVDGRVPKLPLAKGRYRYHQPHWVPVVFDAAKNPLNPSAWSQAAREKSIKPI